MVWLLYLTIHELQYKEHIKNAIFGEPTVKIPLQERKGMRYTYYGYLPYWIGSGKYANFQWELLTHIAYFSVSVDTLGNLGSVPYPQRFDTLLLYAHPRGIRIHMTYTLFGSSDVAKFLNSRTARENAINNIKNQISTLGIEGANMDFEFVTSSVRDSFTVFIQELAETLHSHPDGRKDLYIASPAVPEWYPGYDIAALDPWVDGFFIMAYDFHYSGSSVAGPVAPNVPSSFWGVYSVAKTIGSYIDSGATRQKMVLGMPYYGYDWPTESDEIGSATTGYGSAKIFTTAKSEAENYGRDWDTCSLTPWYSYYTTEWHQTWYDDSVSIGIKLDLALDSMLQGAGCWALGYDDGEDDLWNVIRDRLWIEPPEMHWIVEVNVAGLNIREGPGLEYPPYTYAVQGERFVAFDRKGYWYRIYFPSASGGYYGWMYGGDGINHQYLKGVTEDTILRVTASLLNVREGPSTSYPVITQIARGQCFVPDSFSNFWARIFLPQDTGWCYYATYTRLIPLPEDSNPYLAGIDSVIYPDTVRSQDTFTIRIYVENQGYGPFDSLVWIKTSGSSSFYCPDTWVDDSTAKTWGFSGIPGQHFIRYATFQAPYVTDTLTFEETFTWIRKGTLFDYSFTIRVTVVPQVLYVENEREREEGKKNSWIRVYYPEGRFVLSGENWRFSLYDVAGRKVYEEKGRGRKSITPSLPSGIYFYFFSSGNKKETGKFLKLR